MQINGSEFSGGRINRNSKLASQLISTYRIHYVKNKCIYNLAIVLWNLDSMLYEHFICSFAPNCKIGFATNYGLVLWVSLGYQRDHMLQFRRHQLGLGCLGTKPWDGPNQTILPNRDWAAGIHGIRGRVGCRWSLGWLYKLRMTFVSWRHLWASNPEEQTHKALGQTGQWFQVGIWPRILVHLSEEVE